MAMIVKFESINVWEKSIDLCEKLYDVCYQKAFFTGYHLRNQVCKLVNFIPSQIAKRCEKVSNNIFVYFLLIAYFLAKKLGNQICIINNFEYINKKTNDKLINYLIEINKSSSGFISYLRFRKKSNKQLENNFL